MKGNFIDHIYVNDFVDKKWKRVMSIEQIREVFDRVKENNPKVISFNEAKKLGLTEDFREWRGNNVTVLQCYGIYLLYGWQYEYNDKHFQEFMSDHDQNHFYHGVKLNWLVDIIKNEGLYSVPQAVLFDERDTWFVHPGQTRVRAIAHTECNEDFILWDIGNQIDLPVMTFEEWWKPYDIHKDKSLFLAEFDCKLEVHVGEERGELNDLVKETIDCFKKQKPILEGTCDEMFEDLFTHGTYEGHGIGIKGNFTLENCTGMLDFHPKHKIIENKEWSLFNNYHK